MDAGSEMPGEEQRRSGVQARGRNPPAVMSPTTGLPSSSSGVSTPVPDVATAANPILGRARSLATACAHQPDLSQASQVPGARTGTTPRRRTKAPP